MDDDDDDEEEEEDEDEDNGDKFNELLIVELTFIYLYMKNMIRIFLIKLK